MNTLTKPSDAALARARAYQRANLPLEQKAVLSAAEAKQRAKRRRTARLARLQSDRESLALVVLFVAAVLFVGWCFAFDPAPVTGMGWR